MNVTFPGEWADRGACKGHGEVFFPERKDVQKAFIQAEAICKRCPVKKDCYDHALHNYERGIWAGRGPKFYAAERKRLGIDLKTGDDE